MNVFPNAVSQQIRALVFDLDGTLVDSYAAITDALNRTCGAFGLATLSADQVRAMIGPPIESVLAEVLGPSRVEEGLRIYRARYAAIVTSETHALPAVPETLRELRHRGYRMAVASNKPAYFSSLILEALLLRRLFDAVEGPETAGVAKPHPLMIGRCLDAMGVRADEAAYVGDTVLDVETAEAAGLPVLLVHGGSTSEPSLRATGRPVLASFCDLLELLPTRR